MGKKAPNSKKTVKTLTHDEASRKNIPTAEYQSVMAKEQETPIRVAYERRNRDMDPQLVWRGKDEQDWSDLVTYAPPLYIQEKVHPKVLIDDLLRRSKDEAKAVDAQISVKALREREKKTPTAKQPRKESFPQTISPSLSISSTPCRKYSNDSKATTTTRHKPTSKSKHPQKPKAACSSRRGIYPLYAKGGIARYRLSVLQSLVDEWVNLSQQRWGHLSERHRTLFHPLQKGFSHPPCAAKRKPPYLPGLASQG
jgi:hypothetical protein